MTLVINAIATSPDAHQKVDLAIDIVLGVATLAAAVGLGILLRRLLTQRLKKTVLDSWIVQTLGALIFAIPALLGLIGALAIFNATLVVATLKYSIGGNPATAINAGWNLIQTILISLLSIGIARTMHAIIVRKFGTSRIDINMRTLMARILYIIVICIAIFFILTVWNVPVGIPVAVLGTFTVTLTVALQDVLKNLVAGFYILVERPFFIGDQINITSGMITYIGKVEDIQLRATILRLTSGEEVSVPNLFIFSNSVINNSHFGERRSILLLTMPQEQFDRDAMTSQILHLLKQYTEVMDHPEPTVMADSFQDGNITLNVRFWVATTQVIDISGIIYELHNLFPHANISVKEPI
ncbi:mechanosensitive ion channel family protein [Dictyobacter arantiisoli]|uniref:Mechanosensitive ion channel MscS domain-containing protein n=1 Tax=Dictyobacter arantiisoli TaxID=2014874 RepID=A0A5A5T8B7_9CHLR|nr:mechanosensitive ion channel domain-containing protein [Dictyobacter arantiisoli]GCF07652.1 hypothetical protein KDI_12160 [Dictyobacter arantiisoli]